MRVVDMNNFSLPKESQHFLLLTGLRHAAEWLQGRYTIVVQPLDLPVNDPTADPDPGSDSCAICLRSAGRHRQGPVEGTTSPAGAVPIAPWGITAPRLESTVAAIRV